MLSLLSWIGLAVFAGALSLDFYREWLAPRLLSRPWFPGEPDLPPVAGEVEEADQEDVNQVLLATYVIGIAIFLIGLLDAAPVKPGCLPYSDFINSYLVSIFLAAAGILWYSDGRNVLIPFHAGIRFVIGIIAILIPLYSKACGSGVL